MRLLLLVLLSCLAGSAAGRRPLLRFRRRAHPLRRQRRRPAGRPGARLHREHRARLDRDRHRGRPGARLSGDRARPARPRQERQAARRRAPTTRSALDVIRLLDHLRHRAQPMPSATRSAASSSPSCSPRIPQRFIERGARRRGLPPLAKRGSRPGGRRRGARDREPGSTARSSCRPRRPTSRRPPRTRSSPFARNCRATATCARTPR